MNNSDYQLENSLFTLRENEIEHFTYENEMSYYELVKRGDLDKIKERDKSGCFRDLDGKGQGILSNNRIHNLRYHLIINIAFITRFCIEGGMDVKSAYALSDMYIQQADVTNDYEELMSIHVKSVYDFTRRMSQINVKPDYTTLIINTIDYISDHLHEHLGTDIIARKLGSNTSYLSRQFKKETGVTITSYIYSKKIDAACSMLKYSELPISVISSTLSFCSQSYFTVLFKKHNNMTPAMYRKKYYRKALSEITTTNTLY